MNYAALNDGSDDDESGSDFGKSKKPFSSDDEDELLDNTGIKEQSMHQAQMDESADLFDSLKEDTPVKKPKVQARKLGAKPEVVKDPSAKSGGKRSKKAISDDDSPIKVSEHNLNTAITSHRIFVSVCATIAYGFSFAFSIFSEASSKEEEEGHYQQR